MASKHFKTAKDEQTAPTINNASIYRAGQNPTKQPDSDDDQEYLKNSFYVPDTLQSHQQPTFVDALKRRRDHTGRVITKSQLLNKRSNRTPSSSQSSIPHEPKYAQKVKSVSPPIAKDVQFNNKSIYPCTEIKGEHSNNITKNKHQDTNNINPESNENENGNDSSDEESSDSDFDMDNLTVPKVETENGEMIDLTNKQNEADDIRDKFKQRLKLEKQKQSESAPQIVKPESMKMDKITKHESDDSDSDDEDESSEYETASSSEDDEEMHPRRRNIKYITEKQREEQDKQLTKPPLDEQAEILEKMEEDRHEKLKEEATEDALNYIREQDELAMKGGDNSDEDMPDDNDDDFDGEEGQKEFELWKLREIKRNLRDETLRQEREKEKEEIERRRKMTDEEIMRENEKLGLNKDKKKGTMKFMQKYYHQGVFYRDGSIVEENILDRDFNKATGQDKYIDFEKVPEAMKRKNFGKMSQSKWTHLANEDTTFDKEEREWFKKRHTMNEEERRKTENKRYQFRHRAHENNFWFNRGGDGSFDRPSYKKGNVSNSNKRFEKTDYKKYNKDKDRKRRDRDRGRGRRDRSKSPYRSSRRRQ